MFIITERIKSGDVSIALIVSAYFPSDMKSISPIEVYMQFEYKGKVAKFIKKVITKYIAEI